MASHPIRRLLALLACAYCISAASFQKLDSSWKTYSNRKLGYCLEYPARWVRGEAFDGDGMYFETGVKKFSLPIGEIDVSLLRGEVSSNEDYIQMHLKGLQKFERAKQVEVLESRAIKLRDAAGRMTRNRYFDPQDGKPWIDELVVVVPQDNRNVYRLELECRADALQRLEPVFVRMLNSFQVHCNERH